ncbi:hypothetical protein ACVWW5_000140 [Bradyrhizobium sp. LM3.4]
MPGISNIGKPPPCVSISIFLVVELACPQLFAERVPRCRAGIGADQRVEHALLGGKLRACLHVFALALTDLGNRDLDEVAHDLLDVAADIADLGEFRRLDLQERRVRQLGEPPRDLGLADTGRADHQDVFRQYLFAQGAFQLLPPPAVTQRDRDGSLGIGLADDETVEFRNDFTGRKVCHGTLARVRCGAGQAAFSSSDDRRTRLPLFHGLDRMDQHQDIERQIVANMQREHDFEGDS